MEKVLFGQSYYLRFDPKLWEAMRPYPPLGTLYAASYVRERGYPVALFDAMLADDEARWQEALERERPRFAVLYEDNFNYLSKMCLLRMRQAAFRMLAMARARGCTSIVCGADASDHAEAYLEQGADVVIVGSGEQSLGALLDQLSGRDQRPLESIRGLVFRAEDGALLRTPRQPELDDLDALPFPAWDLVEVERYRAIWQEHHGHYSMNMVTTRGCPYHCNWCAKPIWGQRYYARSPEQVAQELVWLKQRYQPDHIWFVDDIMGLKPGWLQCFAELVEQHDARIPFKCLSRVDLLLREGEIAALRRAGAQTIWVGAESGSQRILNAMEKGTRVEQIYEAARRVQAAGMQIGFFLQFGYPGETRAEIEQTLQMVRDCRPDDIGMSVSYPLPGTRFYEAVREQLGAQQNWQDSSDLAMLYQGPFTTAFYRRLHIALHKEFRARRSWEELRTALRRPSSLRWRHLRRLAAWCYQRSTLPLERLRLARLARIRHQGLELRRQTLALEAAAQPSPQHE